MSLSNISVSMFMFGDIFIYILLCFIQSYCSYIYVLAEISVLEISVLGMF